MHLPVNLFYSVAKPGIEAYYIKIMNDIVCPNCGQKIEIDKAVKHQLEGSILKEEREKQKIELEKARKSAEIETEKKLTEQSRKEKDLLEQKLIRLQKDRENFEKKARGEAEKEAIRSSRFEKLEYEKRIKDMQIALEDAQRKAKQSSQQLQGEVLELDLEEKLKKAFPNDEFTPVPKGVEGGDILQKVKYKGSVVGVILWETKRTKAWSNSWITKLKDDAAKINASECIIVSQVLPDGITNFDRKDGVWVTFYDHAISISRYIRFLITSISSVKNSTFQTDEEWGKIRDYMLSNSFKNRMQAHFDGIKALRENLDGEKRTTTLRWKRQEALIDKLDNNTLNFYGELKAIASDIPEIENIEQNLIGDGENEQETLA